MNRLDLRSKVKVTARPCIWSNKQFGSIFSHMSGMHGCLLMKHYNYSLPGPHDSDDLFKFQRSTQDHRQHFIKTHFSNGHIPIDGSSFLQCSLVFCNC